MRSGAYYSMPGMMDTILNLGLNDSTVEALSRHTGNRAFALDCYRRFLQMYGDVVLKIEHNDFERALETIVKKYKVRRSQELPVEGWERVIERYKQIIEKENGKIFPQSPHEQLINSVSAVFGSWNNPRAKVYRRLNGIPDDLGTAVNIQAMVFGNLGESSGTGVAFTRDPSTGEKRLYGEFLFDSQGEDVVAGIRTPLPITVLQEKMPDIYTQFNSICDTLEKHYHDMQDIEFTIEKGKLYILQTRNGKRTAGAAVKIAVDMVAEGICTKEEALLRVDPSQLVQLLHQRIDHTADLTALAEGLPASPGAAAGRVVFDANMAEKKHQEGEKTILVRPETTPDDIHGIVAAQGVLTSRGGMTSHAAVVARGMGKPCISGCRPSFDAECRFFSSKWPGDRKRKLFSIDGTTGRVYYGEFLLSPGSQPGI